jgi:hypothetical protein
MSDLLIGPRPGRIDYVNTFIAAAPDAPPAGAIAHPVAV